MRKLLLLTLAMCFWWAAYPQDSYFDDFESYAVGSFIAEENPTWWDTWSSNPGSGEDGQISDDFAFSGANSVVVDEVGGSTDLILLLGDKTSGKWDLSWMMYVETGYGGYYNLQHFESPGIEWACELYFLEGGTGELYAGSSTPITFNYPKDTWFSVQHEIDIDSDWITLYVDGVMVHEWPFSNEASSTGGTNQLGGVDFFAGAVTGESPKYYFDDVNFEPMQTVLYEDDFEAYTAGEFIAVVNPTWWTTWSNNPGSGEDGEIVDDQANSPVNSVSIDEIGGSSDLILKLGDRTSGMYDLDWYMFVDNALAGYYNIQHFESPGIEWAFEVYFLEDGSGELYAGSSTPITFTYPKATWFPVHHVIDIDNDWIQLYIDGIMVHEWPFSNEASSTGGTNQLGGVDFYAGAVTGESPQYYFDDVLFVESAAAVNPEIVVDPATLAQTVIAGNYVTAPMTISNTGTADLEWQSNIIYVIPGEKSAPVVSNQEPGVANKTLAHVNAMADPTPNPANWSPSSDDVILHYDGDPYSAIGWSSAPITVKVAARFPNSMVVEYAGMEIESVDIYINDLNPSGSNEMTLYIWGMGETYEPGAVLHQQSFTPLSLSWNNVLLSTPVVLTGEDIWVGYQFTQSVTDIFIPGCDEGPNDPNGDFLSTGVGWSHLSSNPDLPYNWNIRANCTGTPVGMWLECIPPSGTVAAGGEQELEIAFDATSMEVGVYEAMIRFLSNDPVNSTLDVPVTMTVIPVGVPETPTEAKIAMYPNPATDHLNIASTEEIIEIQIFNYLGQNVLNQTVGSEKYNLNTSNLSTGMYSVKVKTLSGESTTKIMIK